MKTANIHAFLRTANVPSEIDELHDRFWQKLSFLLDLSSSYVHVTFFATIATHDWHLRHYSLSHGGLWSRSMKPISHQNGTLTAQNTTTMWHIENLHFLLRSCLWNTLYLLSILALPTLQQLLKPTSVKLNSFACNISLGLALAFQRENVDLWPIWALIHVTTRLDLQKLLEGWFKFAICLAS